VKLLPGTEELDRVPLVAGVLLYAIADRVNERFGLGFDPTLDIVRPAELKRREKHEAMTPDTVPPTDSL
jgi:hypothetical protein